MHITRMVLSCSGGACHAIDLAIYPGSSYLTFSPLLRQRKTNSEERAANSSHLLALRYSLCAAVAVYFLWRYPALRFKTQVPGFPPSDALLEEGLASMNDWSRGHRASCPWSSDFPPKGGE